MPFLACDRDQAFLLPPDLRDWLPADHLAWFVLDVVDQLDLAPFLKAYRADGHGRAAYEPRMPPAVLLYGYCTGVRSSRQIERRCTEDIAFRVLAGNSRPDGTVASGSKVQLAGSRVEPLPVQTAARSAQCNQSWHRRWCSWILVEDAGLSGRQMQQCLQKDRLDDQGPSDKESDAASIDASSTAH